MAQQWQPTVVQNGTGFNLCFTDGGASHTIPMTRAGLQQLYAAAGQYLIGTGGVQQSASKTAVASGSQQPRKGAAKRTRAK